MNKDKKYGIAVLIVIVGAIIHCAFQLWLVTYLVNWGYSETPPSDAVLKPVQVLFFILNPLTPAIGYLDCNIIRLRDYWYYLSAIASALLWSSAVAFLVIHKLTKNTANNSAHTTA